MKRLIFGFVAACFSYQAQAGCLQNIKHCWPSGGKISNKFNKVVLAAGTFVNPEWYSDSYGDLKQSFGYHRDSLVRHYGEHGAREGRLPSPGFNPQWYLDNNSDLKATFGNNTEAAFVHWYEWGARECRKGSPDFDPVVYLNSNPDLKAAYGADCFAAAKHFTDIGYKENRISR